MSAKEEVETRLSKSTIASYGAIAGRYIEQFQEETGLYFREHSSAFQDFLIKCMSDRYSSATLRRYRSAITYVMKKNDVFIDLSGISPAREIVSLNGRKSKKVPLDVANEMLKASFLSGKFGLSAQMGTVMLRNSILFGLRPVEWLSVEYDEKGCRLIIKNAKHSHGRSFGPTRTLQICKDVDPLVLESIEWLIGTTIKKGIRVSSCAEADYNALRRISNAVSRVHDSVVAKGRRAKTPRYTLYSARHQFAANAKASGFSVVEIAAMMGHASVDTAAENYGRRRSGSSGGFLVTPSEADIQAVESIVFERYGSLPSFVF